MTVADRTPATLASVERPTCGTHVGDWTDETGTGVWGSDVRGDPPGRRGAHVGLCAWQAADGTVDGQVAGSDRLSEGKQLHRRHMECRAPGLVTSPSTKC
jgi:hypothetical protein